MCNSCFFGQKRTFHDYNIQRGMLILFNFVKCLIFTPRTAEMRVHSVKTRSGGVVDNQITCYFNRGVNEFWNRSFIHRQEKEEIQWFLLSFWSEKCVPFCVMCNFSDIERTMSDVPIKPSMTIFTGRLSHGQLGKEEEVTERLDHKVAISLIVLPA